MSEGKDIPLMRAMPDLTFWEVTMWNAFSMLSNRRQSGMGISPIAYQDIITFLNEEQIFDYEVRDTYKHFIIFLDNHFIEIKSDEGKRKRSQPGSQGKVQKQPALNAPKR